MRPLPPGQRQIRSPLIHPAAEKGSSRKLVQFLGNPCGTRNTREEPELQCVAGHLFGVRGVTELVGRRDAPCLGGRRKDAPRRKEAAPRSCAKALPMCSKTRRCAGVPLRWPRTRASSGRPRNGRAGHGSASAAGREEVKIGPGSFLKGLRSPYSPDCLEKL